MPDSFTSKLNLTKPEVGASTDTWGTKINADLDSIDSLFDSGPYLKLAKGGTGAGTAADARTNLGLGALATKALITSSDITDGTIVYADLQNISATSRVLGRKTAGAGVTEELTLSDVLDFVGSAAQGDILYRGASSWTRLAAGTSGQALVSGGSGANPRWASSSGIPDVIIEDQKTSGTAGGTAVADTWTERTLNTLVRNNGTLATLSADRFTLPAGTYYISAASPFYNNDGHLRIRLYNVTDASVTSLGRNVETFAGSSPNRPNQFDAVLNTVFTIADTKTFSIEYNADAPSGTSSLGVASGLGTEVYTQVMIWKAG